MTQGFNIKRRILENVSNRTGFGIIFSQWCVSLSKTDHR